TTPSGVSSSSQRYYYWNLDALSVAGTIRIEDASQSSSGESLHVSARQVHVEPTGLIDFDGSFSSSGDGGDLNIWATLGGPFFRIAGTIDVSGLGPGEGGSIGLEIRGSGTVSGTHLANGG